MRYTSPPRCSGPACVDVEALRSVLGAGAILEALEAKATGRPAVNAGQMWRYFTTSVYASGDLPVIATREALQNSADAIRAAIKQRQIGPKEGRFDVNWNPAERTLSWADNGIGMSADTILSKFLTLGDSGKSTAEDSSDAAGGFGIAKAVILGVSESFKWELLSRDNRAVSSGPGSEVEIYDAPLRQGTRITVFDVPSQFDSRYSYARDKYEPLLDRLRLVLAVNDLPEARISLNGETVEPLFSRRAGSRIAAGGDWGVGTTATAKGYRRPPGQRGGAFYIRLGGLFQFDRSSHVKLPADIVVDLHTTIRPGQRGYPLNAARDQLQAEAQRVFQSLMREVERENESAGDQRDYEVFLPEGDDSLISESTRAALSDPSLQRSMRQAAGGLRAYYDELSRQPRSLAAPSSQAPAGSRVEPTATFPLQNGFAELSAEQLAKSPVRAAVSAVKEVMAGNLDAQTEGALDRAARGAMTQGDVAVVAEVVATAASKGIEGAMKPGGAGLLQAALLESQMAPLVEIVDLCGKDSDNFVAEMLLRAVGEGRRLDLGRRQHHHFAAVGPAASRHQRILDRQGAMLGIVAVRGEMAVGILDTFYVAC